MKTTTIGKDAEKRVAAVLKHGGYKILAMNWKTRVSEIDIVARKDNIIYFVEVKYRSSEKQGDGLDYMTLQKLKKVHFAANIWNQQNKWNGDYRLLAAAVSDAAQIEIVEIN
jgi:putative endonuclease